MHDDYEEIRELIHSYPERIDRGDFEGVAELFAHARVIAGNGQVFEGRHTLLELWRSSVRTYEGGSPSTRHLVGNVVVHLSEDARSATARSDVAVLQARPEFPLQVIAVSRHEDAFEKFEGRWRFTERRDHPVLAGDLSHHVQPPRSR